MGDFCLSNTVGKNLRKVGELKQETIDLKIKIENKKVKKLEFP